MTAVFWDSISGKIADRLTAQIAAPAAVFWVSGFIAWIIAAGWRGSGERLLGWLGGLTGPEQVIIAAGCCWASCCPPRSPTSSPGPSCACWKATGRPGSGG